MEGGRIITGEQRSALSTYLGVGIAIILMGVVGYFFLTAQREIKETAGFDPNRPVPDEETVQRRLGAERYAVVRGTRGETPFQNKLFEEQRPGIYVDVITGEPLFTSLDKYNSGLGLPAFSKPISNDLVVTVVETSPSGQRTEVRAKRSNARLGHLFSDPKSPTGQFYSIYSIAVNFISRERMNDEGYESFQPLLDTK